MIEHAIAGGVFAAIVGLIRLAQAFLSKWRPKRPNGASEVLVKEAEVARRVAAELRDHEIVAGVKALYDDQKEVVQLIRQTAMIQERILDRVEHTNERLAALEAKLDKQLAA